MRFLYVPIFLMMPTFAFADIGHDYCFDEAARGTGINKYILMAIAKVESGFNHIAINRNNKNGTEDIGVMQINSSHLPFLKEAGIKRTDLFNACLNIHIGALILKDCIKRHGNTWEAVGAYNAGSAQTWQARLNRARYVAKVWKEYKRLKRLS